MTDLIGKYYKTLGEAYQNLYREDDALGYLPNPYKS